MDYQITIIAFGIASGTSEEIKQNGKFVKEVFMSYYSKEGNMSHPTGNALEMLNAERLEYGMLLAKKYLKKIGSNITFPSPDNFR